ncbi:MAG TPA: hypothetical protein VH637_04755 [Streptosporangiaceae bacterium]|jgi:hypothetical protein
MRFRAGLLAAGLLMAVATTTAMAGPALAAPTAPTAVNPHWYEYRGIHKTSRGIFSGDWVRCEFVSKANYTQTASCSKGKSVSTTISVTFGYTKAEISASVGFSVSYTSTVTAGNSVTIKPGGSGWFDVGFRYHGYSITMQKRICYRVGGCSAWGNSHKIIVQQHLGPTFHYFGTGAK